MKMLAVEFSSDHRSVAVLDGENLLAEKTITEGRNTAAVQLIEETLTACLLYTSDAADD